MQHRLRRHRFLAVVLILAFLCGALLLDSRFRLVVSEYELVSDRLPAAFDGYRIVQLSDVHGTRFGSGSRRLLRSVEEAQPDLIALTGDLIDGKTDLAVIDTLLSGLVEIAPVYFVSGNHEWDPDADFSGLRALLNRHGVTYLRNEYVLLERAGETIALAGVEDPNGWKDMLQPDGLVRRIAEKEGDCFTVLLGHRNEWPVLYPDLAVDLILCGHAHGGVIRIPYVGGLIGHGGELFPRYTEGAHVSSRYTMIISRGLGSAGIVPRLFNNPEIVAVTLHTA